MRQETERCEEEEELMRGSRRRKAMMQGETVYVGLPNGTFRWH